MKNFVLFAEPWWVNLLILVPFLAYAVWRRGGKLELSVQVLFFTAIFAIAFGFVEASVVVYLRSALGLLPGFEGTLGDVIRSSLSLDAFEQARILGEMPRSLLTVEIFREVATIFMLFGVVFAVVRSIRERVAVFLWTFAIWDISYYIGLWATTRWPSSLLTPDILFLIPVPWIAQVWFPILISALTVIAVAVSVRYDSAKGNLPNGKLD